MTEIRVSFPADLINRVGSYLAQRPWNEVNAMLSDLQTKGVTVEAPLKADYSDVSVDGNSLINKAFK